MTHSTGMTVVAFGVIAFLGSWVVCAYYSIRLGLSRPTGMTFTRAINLLTWVNRLDDLAPEGRRYLKRAWICMGVMVVSFVAIAVAHP